jgi:two-component system sensor histidine kinase AgrC
MKFANLIMPYITMAFNLYAFIKVYELISSKKVKISIFNILVMLSSTLCVYFLNYSTYFPIKITVSFLVLAITYELLFKEKFKVLIFKTLLIYMILLFCDFLSSTVFLFFPIDSAIDLGKLSLLRNLVTLLDSLTLMLFFMISNINKFISKVLYFFENSNFFNLFIISFIFIVYLLMSFLNATSFEVELFVIIIITMIFFLLLCFVLIFQYFKNKQSEEEQKVLLELMNEYEKMLDNERMNRHEMLNNLIIIKSFKHKSSVEFENTLDEIIDSYREEKSKIYSNLYKLPSGLKGIIYYKMSKIKQENVDLNLFCSKDIDDKLENLKSKLYFKSCKIIGILLDNAIEASSSSVEKYLLIDIYFESNDLVVYIENSFENDININNIYMKGVSSKGKNRGYGLYIVNKLVEETEEIDLEQYIENKKFVSILSIKNPS